MMRASALIVDLQSSIATFGDLEVQDEHGNSLRGIDVAFPTEDAPAHVETVFVLDVDE